MAKKVVGRLYNKPVIEGEVNLKKNTEIHVSELFSSSNTGGEFLYFDGDKIKELVGTANYSYVPLLFHYDSCYIDSAEQSIVVEKGLTYYLYLEPIIPTIFSVPQGRYRCKGMGDDLDCPDAYSFIQNRLQKYAQMQSFSVEDFKSCEITKEEFEKRKQEILNNIPK